MFRKILLYISFCLTPWLTVYSQNTGVLKGIVYNTNNEVLSFTNISVRNTSLGTLSNENGEYSITLPANTNHNIVYSFLGYTPKDTTIYIPKGKIVNINIFLEEESANIEEVKVIAESDNPANLVRLEIKDIDYIPSTSGSFESILKTVGVSSSNELSSQYTVRGGNFDENLVYVNDIEVYRPMLIQSGQQEGLSFINSDMVSSVQFSAGGFDAEYGDKLSSVLDIKYRQPTEFGGSVYAGVLGAGLQIEGTGLKKKFTHNSGIRYKTNRYLLGSLETQGDYSPEFIDYQTYLTYKLSEKAELSFLGNISSNSYSFFPTTRSTTFGTISNALNLTIYYEGGEADKFNTYTGALSLDLTPNENLSLKFIVSDFLTQEIVSYDILGQYLINQLDNQLGSETAGDSVLNIGIGTFLRHERSTLEANVLSLQHKGTLQKDLNTLKWGVTIQEERVDDIFNRWELVDSAGYSVPYTGDEVNLSATRKGEYNLISYRYMGFLQNTFTLSTTSTEYFLTAGCRVQYSDLNNDFLVSPRASLSINPDWLKDIRLKLATGVYQQPPFHKELLSLDGQLFTNVKAQKSIHYVAGLDYYFNAWDRPFKFTTEIYYKDYKNLIPYKLDNVRVQYYPNLQAKGYAAGIEFKLNGEFVPGAQSWASITLLKTEEDVFDDYYIKNDLVIKYSPYGRFVTVDQYKVTPRYYPRPTDQRFNFNLFFQDYFPFNPDYKVHLNVVYGSRLPTGNILDRRMDRVYRIPPYRRVDIGFSKSILPKKLAGKLESMWLSAEVFNIIGIKNTISYLWVKTVQNQSGAAGQWAVPNYLTTRRINIKLSAKF